MLNRININAYFDLLLKVALIFVACVSYGQQNEDLLSYAEDIKVINPVDAIRISENVLRRSDIANDKNCNIYTILIEANSVLENYDKTIEYILKLRESKCHLSDALLFKIALLEAKVYHIIKLKSHENASLVEAYELLEKTKDRSLREVMNWQLEVYRLQTQVSDGSLENQSLKIPEMDFMNSSKVDEFFYIEYLALLGEKSVYSDKKFNFKSYLEANYPEYLGNNYDKIYYENYSLLDAQYYTFHNEYEESISILKNTKSYLSNSDAHFYYKNRVIDALISNYIESKDKTSLLEARKEGEEIKAKILEIETSIINIIIKNKKEQNNKELEDLIYQEKRTVNTFILIALVIISITAVFWFRYYWQEKQYTEVRKYLNKLEDKSAKIEVKTKSVTKISEELENKIIEGLKDFQENEEFLNNNVSLAYLASKLEVNTRYLSEFLNSQLNESFSSYINRLRVEFIVGKLKNDSKYLKYKISYLADISGYTSHSSFTIAFKSVTGMSPTKFITYLKK